MHKLTRAMVLLPLTCGLALFGAGAAFGADSGFLPDYSKLKAAKDDKQITIKRWVSPKFTKANYSKVLIEKVTFYPEPKGSEQVSDAALHDIQAYLDHQVRTVALAGLTQVTEAGPGVARVKIAVTAAATSASGLKPWQILPVMLVVQGAKAAGGIRPKDVDLDLEVIVSDSTSNEPLSMSVRKLKGVTVPDASTQVTLEMVKPQVDAWAEGAAKDVATKVK